MNATSPTSAVASPTLHAQAVAHGKPSPRLLFALLLALRILVLGAGGGLLTGTLALLSDATRVAVDGYPPLSKPLADYRELGGRLLACPLGVNKRGIDAALHLVGNAEVVAAGRFLLELGSAPTSSSTSHRGNDPWTMQRS